MKPSINPSKFLFLLIFLLLSFNHASQAQEHVLAGAIDSKHMLHMFLTVKGDKAEASYFYDRVGTPIVVSGQFAAGKLTLENATERFTGSFDGKFFSGAWTDKRRRHDMQFALQPADTDFKDVTGRHQCRAHRSGEAGSVEVPLTLQLKAGTVTQFAIESRVMPHAHTCNPDHSRLRQTARGNMLIISGTADPDTPCTMHLKRAGPFIHIANAVGACLCGARASIPDVLLDTRNNTCRIAQ